MKYKKRRDNKGQWRWVLFADNGEPISVSSEAYVREADCDRGIELSKASWDAPVERIPPQPSRSLLAEALMPSLPGSLAPPSLLGSLPSPLRALSETLVSGQSAFQKRHR